MGPTAERKDMSRYIFTATLLLACIANPKDDPDQGQFKKASVHLDQGTFTIQIGPTGRERTYRVH